LALQRFGAVLVFFLVFLDTIYQTKTYKIGKIKTKKIGSVFSCLAAWEGGHFENILELDRLRA